MYNFINHSDVSHNKKNDQGLCLKNWNYEIRLIWDVEERCNWIQLYNTWHESFQNWKLVMETRSGTVVRGLVLLAATARRFWLWILCLTLAFLFRFYMFPSPMLWVSSGFYGFLLQFKGMQVRSTGYSKLLLSVLVVNCACVSPVTDWRPVQSVPSLS